MRSGGRYAAQFALAALVASAGTVLWASPGQAQLSSGCHGRVYATPNQVAVHNDGEGQAAGGSFADPAQQDELHAQDGAYLSGYGHVDADQTHGYANIVVFGFPYQVASGSGMGRDGAGGPFSVTDYGRFVSRVKIVGGSDNNGVVGCSGSLTVIFDGRNPVATIVGGGSLLHAVIGLAGLIGVALRRRPI